MRVKNVTVTGSWADISNGQDPAPITKDLFGIWLEHGVKPTAGSYAYVVRPNVTASQAGTYAASLPVRIISNTTAVQAVRHDPLGIAQLLFHAAGTARIRDGLSVTVNQPCLLIVDESGGGAPVFTVANPHTPNLVVAVTLTTGTTSTTRTVALPGGADVGRSVTVGGSAGSLSYRRPVTVSSTAASEVGAHFLTDGNPRTRWGSQYSDAQWAQVDLLSIQPVRKVTLTWEAAHASAFTVELSSDGSVWRQVHSTTTGSGGTQTITFVQQAARFVRVSMSKRATGYGYSLWGIDVDGAPDLALGRPVTASSVKAPDVAAANVTDGNTATRWGSDYSDPQWIRVDLGGTRSIGAVLLRWEAASAKAFTIDVSNDDQSWTTVYSTTGGAGGVQLVPITANARYVRMRGTVRSNTRYGYSLWSLEVYPS
jgi:chondroitin AC lyase